MMILCGSPALALTSRKPSAPAPPDLLITTIGRGIRLCLVTIPWMSRAIWSAPPPEPAGTMKVTCLVGCHAAMAGVAMIADIRAAPASAPRLLSSTSSANTLRIPSSSVCIVLLQSFFFRFPFSDSNLVFRSRCEPGLPSFGHSAHPIQTHDTGAGRLARPTPQDHNGQTRTTTPSPTSDETNTLDQQHRK